MSKKHRKRPDAPPPQFHPRRRVPVWLPALALVLFLAAITGFAIYLSTPEGRQLGSGKTNDLKSLVGRWLRPDGGYVIDIRTVHPDGKLDATYSNPSPIKVSKAEAKTESGKITVLVELRDEGYPGNYYTLTYDPSADQLAGVYHQLGQGQQYPVTFERIKARE